MLLRHISALASALALAALPACAVDETDVIHQDIAWGSTDTGVDPVDQLKRDVVVHLQVHTQRADGVNVVVDCTGTLVTPRVAITSSGCLRGLEEESMARAPVDRPTVYLGESVDAPKASVVADGALAYINRRVNHDTSTKYEVATDVAIVYLPPSVPFADDAISTRPSFQSEEHNGLQLAGYASENLDHGNRQVGWLDYHRQQSADARYFETDGAAMRIGDDGGPAFRTRADGTRDLLGVQAAFGRYLLDKEAHYTLSADITSDLMSNWIRDNVQDLNRRDGWYFRHDLKKGDYWLGEVDYTGPCRYAEDFDCDHWINDHDDCRFVRNIDQAESLDDGIGDACRADPPRMPTSCTVTDHCGLWVDFACDRPPAGDRLRLESRGSYSGGEWVAGGRDPGDWEYRVCAETAAGEECTKSLTVDHDKAACGCPLDRCTISQVCALPDGQDVPPYDDDPDFKLSCGHAGGELAPKTTCDCR
jgi:hypothetical protein